MARTKFKLKSLIGERRRVYLAFKYTHQENGIMLLHKFQLKLECTVPRGCFPFTM